MRVLMLGWEFPPFITGGLGTACHGLTKALDRRGMHVTFVLPKAVGGESAQHVRLLSPTADAQQSQQGRPGDPKVVVTTTPGASKVVTTEVEFQNVRFIGIPAGFANPYQRTAGQQFVADVESGKVGESHAVHEPGTTRATVLSPGAPGTAGSSASAAPMAADYGGDLLAQVTNYSQFCVEAAMQAEFDIIHAHDWMTYPAGLSVARLTGKPLVVHVHSTEFDRSGEHVNQMIYDVERRGMHSAMCVITVSQLTKNLVVQRYGVLPQNVEVVYNGVDMEPTQKGGPGIRGRDKIVLYFGRITHQKGPEYFIAAAKRVLDVLDNVKFVVAGSGDMARRMIEMAADMGIGHKVLFTGFLRGKDIQRVFALADLYVMPSVSEPFGIAPLEAMSNDVPALISKSSGVSEVLTHVLKVDFWDIDDMADKIIAVLRHPPLSQTLRRHGRFEIRRLTWDGAAQRCEQIYRSVVAGMEARDAVMV